MIASKELRYDALVLVSHVDCIKKRDIANFLINFGGKDSNNFFKILKSDTTKPQDATGLDNLQHNFIDSDEFEYRKKKLYYIETDVINGHQYGTPRDQYLVNKKDRKITIFLVDTQSVKKLCTELEGENVLVVFIDPTKTYSRKHASQDSDIVCTEKIRCVYRKTNASSIAFAIYKKIME